MRARVCVCARPPVVNDLNIYAYIWSIQSICAFRFRQLAEAAAGTHLRPKVKFVYDETREVALDSEVLN